MGFVRVLVVADTSRGGGVYWGLLRSSKPLASSCSARRSRSTELLTQQRYAKRHPVHSELSPSDVLKVNIPVRRDTQLRAP